MVTLGERLFFLRSLRKLTAKDVMDSINIDNLGRYEKNERKPSIDILLSIAKFYDVTTDWLLTGEGEMYGNSQVTCTSSDKLELINGYMKLTKYNKARVLERISTLLEQEKCEKSDSIPQIPLVQKSTAVIDNKRATIEMLVYDQKASAGLGNYLCEDAGYEMLSFYEDEVPSRADFGIRIQGDSMEPEISDGGIVWVKEQVQIENGQIGIFILNEESLCKKLHISDDNKTVQLVSLNKKYKPREISPDDFLRTVGRVLL